METIQRAVDSAAREFGDRPAIVEPGGPTITYAQLRERVRSAAATFLADGIVPGDRVAIWAPNSHHWVVAALGALYAGGVLVPINTRYTGAEASDILQRSGAKALVVSGPFLGRDYLASLDYQPGLVRQVADPFTATAEVFPEVDADQVCDILFTSGTTGQSKGAMSAQRQTLSVARAWAELGGLSTADRYLIVNPFFHSFGYKAGILACLVSGATMVPQAVYNVDETMRLVENERITVLPGAPTIYQTMLDHPSRQDYDLSSLRLAVTGAATIPVALVERMQTELSFDTVLTAYGLTEAVVATMCRPGDPPTLVATTSGRAAAGFEVRIGDNSEILLRGPNVMLGYLDNPEATAAAIDGEGWLHTGDVGILNEEGYLKITDRLKDMYICGGFNVYPAEVEQVLARLDGVSESVVIGVPDARLGEVGKAYVIPRAGRTLSEEDVLFHCRAYLANYKVPRVVEFRTDFPRNATGKPLKRVLRDDSSV